MERRAIKSEQKNKAYKRFKKENQLKDRELGQLRKGYLDLKYENAELTRKIQDYGTAKKQRVLSAGSQSVTNKQKQTWSPQYIKVKD